MGSAYFVVPAEDIPGYDPTAVEGKMLARAEETLEQAGFYARHGLDPLHVYCGDDMSDLAADFGLAGLGGDLMEEQWFEADAGLKVVRALAAHLAANPGAVEHQDIVVADLALFESVLVQCAARGVPWHLSIDV